MQYTVKFNPIRITGRTKSEVMDRATTGYCPVCGGTSAVSYHGYTKIGRYKEEEKIRVINYKKHRRITKHDKNKKTIVVSPAYWEAFIYDIPVSFLKMIRCNLTQHTRNFSITPSKIK